MSTENMNLSARELPEWFDPFPEPHTMPRGWNLDGVLGSPEPAAAEQPDDSSESHLARHQGSLPPYA
jgi:hypothetical protein